jgi:K+-sensing histidine kinase KdpD
MNFAKFYQNKSIGYRVAVGGIILVTAILGPFHDHINSITIALALLLVILVSATLFGSRPALLASILGVLCFNFFFLPPYYTLTISESQNWIAFFAFLATSLIAGQLSTYARRRAEEAEAKQKKIERLYVQLQTAFDQASQAEALKQSEKLKSALLDAVTHDLRTPLTSIKASVTTLLSDSENVNLDRESKQEFLEIINEETDRLNSFIESIVGLAKIEAGAADLQKSWSAVEEIIGNAIDRAKNRVSLHKVETMIEPDLPNIFVNASSIAEVVYTLLDNAAKYSPKESEILVTAFLADEKTLEIAVQDQGKGIAENVRELVFNKFYQADKKDIHTTASGLGLGLAIARGIIESQGGKIWIEDGRSHFKTRVVFQIPIGRKGEERRAKSEGRKARGERR